MWGMTGTHNGVTAVDKVYQDGALVATSTGGAGLQDHYNLSGYSATGSEERATARSPSC